MRRPLSEVTRYGWALVAVAALGLRSFLTPFPSETVPYLTVWSAVVFSARY